MTREEKAQIIENLTEKFSNTNFFYIADASGLTVAQVNEFRGLCFEKGIEYLVVKNSLIKKALEKLDTDYAPFNDSVLKGFSGVLFSPESGSEPARIIKDFRKSVEGKPVLKGASIDSDLFIGEENLETLSKLKSKTELIGEVISILQSPAKNVISALQSGEHTLAGLVKTLSER
ncbi:50S ribosomal protein L10 [Xanthovirga aplysinae]|uniref:50S ribosomal protein L10 n=1 Tax=Xanthovirga aplysinae TaxID=2529853 RepID=UPI0012BBFA9D|nr:50S ribosomal protein L10 [Xanthovirga aplysinae]MTI32999.1 50S ribosomal protein L10 [Xanthovirga aplysinae]